METFFSAVQTFGRRQMIHIYREEFSVKNDKSCLKDFIRYSSLNVLGMLGLSCYILADTFFISKALGANGLTALNLAIPRLQLHPWKRTYDRNRRRNQICHFQKSGK